MSQPELLRKVIQALENADIQYMVSGSIVSSLQGEPRSTHDIDLVVVIERSMVDELARAFHEPDFYLDKESIFRAIDSRDMFNLLEIETGNKVDFWLLTDDPFDKSRFNRRYTDDFMGIPLHVSSPEDTILAKLKWAKMSGGSEKQFTDALRVYEVQFEKLDIDYLNKWAEKLDTKKMWEDLQHQARSI